MRAENGCHDLLQSINLSVVRQMLDVFQNAPNVDRIQDMQAYKETTNEPWTAIHHKLDFGKNFAFSQKIYSNIFQAK